MIEHVHEWFITTEWDSQPYPVAMCKVPNCEATMNKEDINRALNATEIFTAEMGRALGAGWKVFRDEAIAYADTLEGK